MSLQGANSQHATSPRTFAPKCLLMTNHSYPSASWGPVSAVPVASAAIGSPVPGGKAPGCDSTAALGDSYPENAKSGSSSNPPMAISSWQLWGSDWSGDSH